MKTAIGLVRFVVFRTLIGAADVLPRPWLVAAARRLAWIETFCTARGRSAVSEGRDVLGMSPGQARSTAVAWISRPLIDLVDVRRIARRKEDFTKWTVEERNAGPIKALVESGRGFVLAGGHFSGGIGMAKLYPQVMGATAVMNPPEPWKLDGDILIRRLMKLTTRDLIEVIRPGQVQVREVGVHDAFADMLEAQKQPGGVASLAIDAPWAKPNAIYRPFAGMRHRAFATGAARLSRLSQVPVVLWVPERVGDRHCIVHWGTVREPAPMDRADLDEEVMGELISELEPWVGRLRHQYPHPVGWERRWNRAADRWEERPPVAAGVTAHGRSVAAAQSSSADAHQPQKP
ncbi:MAG TPA: hypothetical protein VN697_05645 [Tepidiformaceae bacterium]|nr:hypothetical protein [Tepidiformaceae bacterium]